MPLKPTGDQEFNAAFRGWLASLKLDSGFYTPTLTNTTNVAASTARKCQYLRVGNTVTVSGAVEIDPTAAAPTNTQLNISLPILTNISLPEECAGTANCANINAQTGTITGSSGTDTAALLFSATDLANRVWYFTFTYAVI